jgi:hypothetical protein
VIANASGRAIGFALAPGQAHELPLAPLLLTLLSLVPGWIVADRGYELWPKLGDGGVRKAAYRGG